ncbi:MAG: hypothetical protein VZR11_13745 [Succinimonas sp.]|nr:hypothetical protein [Succinimonas sp.]
MENHMTPEKKTYIDKLGRQIASVKKILEMDSGEVLSVEEKSELRKLKNEAECLKDKLQKNGKWSEMGVTCHQSCPMPDILLVHHQVYNEIYIL